MLPTNSVIEEVTKLEPVKCMRATVKKSVTYGTIVGATTAISGMIAGPAGLAIGGVISSCVACLMSMGEFQSVPYILLYQTTPEQREKLAKSICGLVQTNHLNTIRDFILTIQTNAELQQAIVQLVIAFLVNEYGANVKA